MRTGPCKDCTKRTYACWGSCEDYILWKKELEDVRRAMKEIKEIDYYHYKHPGKVYVRKK